MWLMKVKEILEHAVWKEVEKFMYKGSNLHAWKVFLPEILQSKSNIFLGQNEIYMWFLFHAKKVRVGR